MEITFSSPAAIKIKGKQATCIVNPSESKAKLAADIVLGFTLHEMPKMSFEQEPLFVSGPGEYESKGMKITGVFFENVVSYQITVDGITLIVTKGCVVEKIKDKFEDAEILVILADEIVQQAAISALDPYVVVIYGEKAEESIKGLGKEVTPVSKYSVTKDKLPSEMEVVLLG